MQTPTPHPAFPLAKIQPPRQRAGQVERPHLQRALAAALREHRLTLLVAPAGYGKTAALAQQIHLLPEGCALAWISADEDDQLQRFLACLSTALEPHDLPWRVAPEALGTLALAERGLRDVAGEFVSALGSAAAQRGLIIIDDVHRITDPRVFELLQAVLDRLPENWTFVIASRVDPPLTLPRWRVAGELAEFRQHELRFSEAEVAALLAQGGKTAEPGASLELLQRTDGWAAGLRLSLSARPGDGPRGRHAPTQRHLFDYLASEVLNDMPTDLRQFLLRCSVLPELTQARCVHVARMPRTARLLEEVERRGLFVVSLDAPELTLRLHDLFRDFLEDRLQREQPDEVPQLLRRAADDEPDLARTIGYLARAGDWEAATAALLERGPALLSVGGGPALEQMLDAFPAAEFERRADLHLLRGLAAFPRFDFAGMVKSMRKAADGCEREGRLQEAALARAYACMGMVNDGQLARAVDDLARLHAQDLCDPVRAFVCFSSAWAAYAQGRAAQVAPFVGEMIGALERSNDPQIWDRCFFNAILTGLPGMKPMLERFAHSATRLPGDTPTQLRAAVSHIRAWLAFSQARIDEAAHWLARADEDVRWLGRPRSLITENWISHTLIDAVRGDRAASDAAAQAYMGDIEDHSLASHRLTHEYEIVFTCLRASWVLGDAAALRDLATRLERAANPFEWVAAEDNRRFARAFVALLDDRLADARELLQPLAAGLDRSCFFPAMQARVMLADVELSLGLADAAAATLRPWLDAAHTGGDVGGALLAGLPVVRRLAAAA